MNIFRRVGLVAGIVYFAAIALYVAVFGTLGGLATNYLLDVFFNKTLPFIGAMLIGLIVGHLAIPIAVVVWILRAFGVL